MRRKSFKELEDIVEVFAGFFRVVGGIYPTDH